MPTCVGKAGYSWSPVLPPIPTLSSNAPHGLLRGVQHVTSPRRPRAALALPIKAAPSHAGRPDQVRENMPRPGWAERLKANAAARPTPRTPDESQDPWRSRDLISQPPWVPTCVGKAGHSWSPVLPPIPTLSSNAPHGLLRGVQHVTSPRRPRAALALPIKAAPYHAGLPRPGWAERLKVASEPLSALLTKVRIHSG